MLIDFQIERTAIPEVLLITPAIHHDNRGSFSETFRAAVLEDAGAQSRFLQENQSRSQRGVLRGLHYQIHSPQGKLVRAVVGEVFDVAVDLRRSSPSFGDWTGERLSAVNRRMLWIPPGFAHGFYSLSEWTEVLYKTTDYYAPDWERTLVWNDPAIGIEWPLIGGLSPLLSEKDAAGNTLQEAETYP